LYIHGVQKPEEKGTLLSARDQAAIKTERKRGYALATEKWE
jgi:hypothetical protein